MDLSPLFALWPIPQPWTLRTLDGGINNLTQWVETPGGTYILRCYRNVRLPQIQYELDVLRALQQQSLSFAVPAPLTAKSGDVLVRVTIDGRDEFATLTPVIPGTPPERHDLAQAAEAGRALGELTRAMAKVHVQWHPGCYASYGQLGDIFPLAPSVADALAPLPIKPEERGRVARLIHEMQEQIPAAYARLPQQIIHGDYVSFNLLMDTGRITGVLDFEFAAPDIRAMDLAIVIAHWPWGLWGTGREWDVIDAVGRGYVSEQHLTPDEMAALPFLMRLRRAASILHHAERYVRGVGAAQYVQGNVEGALETEDWLAGNGAELVRRALRWGK